MDICVCFLLLCVCRASSEAAWRPNRLLQTEGQGSLAGKAQGKTRQQSIDNEHINTFII